MLQMKTNFRKRLLVSLLFLLFAHYFSFSQTAYWGAIATEIGPMIDVSSKASVFKEANVGRQAVKDSRYQGYEIKFAMQPYNNSFASLYHFPKYGLGAYFGDFHNPNIGKPMAVFGWGEIPFSAMRKGQKFSFGYGGEFGVAWNFNPYDKSTNATNVFMGLSVSYIAGVHFYGDYHINRFLSIGTTLGFKHFSNGAWKQPNIGINLFPVSVSAKYQINAVQPPQQPLEHLPEYDKRWKLDVRIAAGRKQNELETPYYYKMLTGIKLLRQLSHKNIIGGGLEATLSFGKKNDGTQRTGRKDRVSPAIVGYYEQILSPQLHIPVECGAYLFPKNIENGEHDRVYVRTGLKYHLTPNFWAGLTVKAHTNLTHVLVDFSEWGIGYTFFYYRK